MTPYTVQYSQAEYVDGRITYCARLMLGDVVPVAVANCDYKTEQDALIGLAMVITQQIIWCLDFALLSQLPVELRYIIEEVISNNYPKGTQEKIRARIRRREARSLKERTV